MDWLKRRVQDVHYGPDSYVTEDEGVRIANHARGLIGDRIVAIGGETNTMTLGSDLIVSRVDVPRGSDLELHELGHAAQARERGLGYLPSYLFEVWQISQRYGLEPTDPRIHFIHSMEIDADARAGLRHLR